MRCDALQCKLHSGQINRRYFSFLILKLDTRYFSSFIFEPVITKSWGSRCRAERRKHNHYIISLKESHLFYPIAFESLGSRCPVTKKFLSVWAIFWKKQQVKGAHQKISIAMQRGNAACIIGTFERKKLDDFYLL